MSARLLKRSRGSRLSRRRRWSFGAWPRARPNTRSRSGPRIERRASRRRYVRFGHGSRRGISVLANRIRAPKDMGEGGDLLPPLPTYIRPGWAPLCDGRVSAQQELILARVGAYLFFPTDLIPD